MLKSLSIRDFALVEKLDLEFEKGMISLTGETGAGKSILLGAIGVIIGEKTKKTAVRNGSDKAIISGVFDISYLPKVKSFLEDKELIDENEPEQCIIRRVLRKDGRSSTFINENNSNLSTLKEIGEMLIEIHGQHQHQNLSKTKKQLDVIDSYSGLKEKRQNVSHLYRKWKDAEKETKSVIANFNDNKDKYQLLMYKKKELEALKIQEGEYQELEEESIHLSSAEHVISSCEEAEYLLKDDNGCLDILNKVISNIESLNEDKNTLEIIEMLESAKINIEEATPLISSHRDSFEINPERLIEVTARIKELDKASESFFCLPENLHTILPSIEEEIGQLNYSEDAVAEAKKNEEDAFNEFLKEAKELSKKRIESSKLLTKEINNETIRLNLAEDILKIDFIKSKDYYSPYGIDDVNFLIRPNLGQEYQKISDIASGGELSRLSLAVQVVSFKNEKKPTMIFDEVDTGLSGETGNVVGDMLRRVGDLGQVMCVTHLPQVAAQGHSHFFVSKNNVEKDGKVITLSNIRELNEDERIKEVARMIGGNVNSKEALDTAQKMLHLEF